MPNKKILVSNDTGKYKEISGSVIDGQISSPSIVINTSSFNTEANGLLQVVNGKIEAITGSGNNYKINYSTELGKFVAEQDTVGELGGDLSGLYTSPRVKSVANVSGGVLPASYGGTGQSTYSSGSLVSTNGGVLSPNSNSDKLIAVATNGQYVFIDKNQIDFTPMTSSVAYLYTGSYGITGTFTWTKPAGCRFVQIICQGGGGSSGTASVSAGSGTGGGGGGGLSIVTLNACNLPTTVIVTAGSGGAGSTTAGDEWATGTARVANHGGDSSFGSYISAAGGRSGGAGRAGGAGGAGYTANGGAGANGGNISYQEAGSYAAASYGASGGGGGASATTGVARTGGYGGAVTSRSIPAAIATTSNGANGGSATLLRLNNVFINNTPAASLPNLVCGGGAGAGYTGSGSPTNVIPGGSEFGGGAGGRVSTTGATRSGGKGYVLIICY